MVLLAWFQRCKVIMSAHCHKSVPVLMLPYILLGCKITINKQMYTLRHQHLLRHSFIVPISVTVHNIVSIIMLIKIESPTINTTSISIFINPEIVAIKYTD